MTPTFTVEDAATQWRRHAYAAMLDQALAARLHPNGAPPVLLHECEDGHTWRQQPDGGVCPSYGMGLTSIKFPGWEPARCPEPHRLAVPGDWGLVRGIRCAGCDELRLPHDLLAGLSCTPWLLMDEFRATGHFHTAPPPVCGTPPVITRMWSDGNWIPITDGVLAAPGDQLSLI